MYLLCIPVTDEILYISIPAIITLLGVILTLFFTNRRDYNTFKREFKEREFNYIRDLYISLLADIEKTKNYTTMGKNYSDLLNESAIIYAKINLFSSPKIKDKLSVVNELLFHWTSLYKRSLPTKIGDTNIGMISNTDFEFREKADKIEPKLNENINELIKLIEIELNKLRKS